MVGNVGGVSVLRLQRGGATPRAQQAHRRDLTDELYEWPSADVVAKLRSQEVNLRGSQLVSHPERSVPRQYQSHRDIGHDQNSSNHIDSQSFPSQVHTKQQ